MINDKTIERISRIELLIEVLQTPALPLGYMRLIIYRDAINIIEVNSKKPL